MIDLSALSGWLYYSEPENDIYLYCGDCMELLLLLPEKSIDLVVTSPPYNMRTRVRNGEYTEREKSEHFSKKYKYFDDALPIDEYYLFHKEVLIELFKISFIIFYNIGIVTGSKEAWLKIIGDFNKKIKDIIIWDKGYGQPAMHQSVLNRCFELILVFEMDAKAGRAFNKKYFNRGEMSDIWRISKGDTIKENKAIFPIEIPKRILRGWTQETDIILDPFVGSGTTLVACKELNRKGIGMEISERYCKISKERLMSTPAPLFKNI